MKKFISLFLISMFFFSSTQFVHASSTDVQERLRDLARENEAGTLNQAWNTDFTPSDSAQLSISPTGGIFFLAPPANIIGERRISLYKVNDAWAKLEGSPTEVSGKPLYAGKNVLDNSKGTVDQEMLTPEFSYTYTESTSNTTTHGLKLGVKTTATMKFPIAQGSMEASTEYNFQDSSTDTTTETVSYKSPSQKIKIPAGKTFRVLAYLNTGSISGKANLYAKVNGVAWMVLPGYPKGAGINIGAVLKKCQQKGWGDFRNFQPSGNNVIVKGQGTFKSDYGTDFVLKIEDITDSTLRNNNGSGIVVQEIKVPLIRTKI
ncbi:ETX/MTX2 family pore-forming toxin [Bacillus cereus]|uniref:ETX/MTX2 family pore-forming toxin n=1 Tax=Bacillus cereus TaxID=1396 RepID=UPI0018F7B4A0|nr:ETX/MTX2 family pore-forming toxin [Bacillus cereus]